MHSRQIKTQSRQSSLLTARLTVYMLPFSLHGIPWFRSNCLDRACIIYKNWQTSNSQAQTFKILSSHHTGQCAVIEALSQLEATSNTFTSSVPP